MRGRMYGKRAAKEADSGVEFKPLKSAKVTLNRSDVIFNTANSR